MSAVQKVNWSPTASMATLEARAKLLATIRQFFAERYVLEVETPLLSHNHVTDSHIQLIPAQLIAAPGEKTENIFLQSSPEHAMKRLLASGSGSIYQLGKVFRNQESGKRHNPEFTMLEWYRVNFSYAGILKDVSNLVRCIGLGDSCETISYEELFEEQLGFNPHTEELNALRAFAKEQFDFSGPESLTRSESLELIFSHLIEPHLGFSQPTLVIDYPADQSALAVVEPHPSGDYSIARRFELFARGYELANGYVELQDANILRQRWQAAGQQPDERLLAAMESGLPACSGVALGVDRCLMVLLGASHIDEVLAFPVERA